MTGILLGQGIGTLTAADTGVTHVGHAGQVIKDRVRGHLDDALAMGPISDTGAGSWSKTSVLKDAFPAVADRTGHAAVVAIDAG